MEAQELRSAAARNETASLGKVRMYYLLNGGIMTIPEPSVV
jgi:hypothetical protein